MDKYKDKFDAICEEYGVEITKIHPVNSDMVEINVAYLDRKPMDVESISRIAKALSEAIDYEIGLDVSSSGVERVLDVSEYGTILNEYVQVKFVKQIDGADYVEGILKEVNDETVTIEYRVLHATKTIIIPLDNIKELSLAVKI